MVSPWFLYSNWLMGLLDKLLGKKEKKGKLEPPLLNEQYHGLMGLEFGMYLSWVEDTTKKALIYKLTCGTSTKCFKKLGVTTTRGEQK